VSVPRQWRSARVLASYLAQENRPYIHLIDGGISDNLGIRNPWRMARDIEHWNNLIQTEQDKNAKRFVAIVVNAQTESPLTWAAIDKDPSVNTLLAAMTNAQIDVLSAETLDYIRTRLALWQQQASAAGLPIKFYIIEVSFHSPENEAERKYLNGLPTTLTLSAEDVDHLRKAAREILRNNPTYQRLLQDISREH
jgi:NTE family protein